jgi:hypothetical protein
MSAEDVALAALAVSAALAAILWFKRRQRDLGERLSRLAEDTERRRTTRADTEPPTLGDALARVQDELSTAHRLLNEVYSIGLWTKSDDSSDNRRKRQVLRETDWAASGALRALTALQQSDVPASIHDLEHELRMLVAILEPLPDTVTDTTGENPGLDSIVGNASDKASELLQRAEQLAAEHGNQGESLAGRGTW